MNLIFSMISEKKKVCYILFESYIYMNIYIILYIESYIYYAFILMIIMILICVSEYGYLVNNKKSIMFDVLNLSLS